MRANRLEPRIQNIILIGWAIIVMRALGKPYMKSVSKAMNEDTILIERGKLLDREI